MTKLSDKNHIGDFRLNSGLSFLERLTTAFKIVASTDDERHYIYRDKK